MPLYQYAGEKPGWPEEQPPPRLQTPTPRKPPTIFTERTKIGRQWIAPCGEPSAYKRHLRWGEDPCEDCRKANAAKQARAKGHTTTGRANAKVAACGTRQGYHRHIQNKEVPCDPCNDANNQHSAEQREKRRRRNGEDGKDNGNRGRGSADRLPAAERGLHQRGAVAGAAGREGDPRRD